MKIFDELTLVEFTPPKSRNKLVNRRKTICEKLSDQISLASDPNYKKQYYKWMTAADGEVRKSKIYKTIKPWWYEDDDGNLVLSIQYRGSPVNLTTEYNGILLSNAKQLVETLYKIKNEFERGALDELTAQERA